MRKAISLVLLLGAVLAWTACGATIWAEPKTKTWKNATGAEAFERLFWAEVKAGNWAEVERRVAVSFSGALPAGTSGRDAFVQMLKSAGVTDFALGEITVRPNAADMVASYTIQLQAASGPSTRHVVSVWQQVGKDWVMIAHAQSPQVLPQP